LEWASTIYDNSQFTGEFPYPYAADDGREDLERTHVSRVVRGGGFFISDDDLRSANRAGTLPGLATFNIGFRCALSF
jgi:formylglycine-generating enzyme required for sulfatase activity